MAKMNPNPFLFYQSITSFFLEQICALCHAELVNAQHSAISYILLFQKRKHICFSLEISVELRELERFSCGSAERALWAEDASVLFLSLLPVHILLTGHNASALYCWNWERNTFSFVLEAPAAQDAAFVTVKSLNSSKALIALAGAAHSHFYELAYISSQSDFIPR